MKLKLLIVAFFLANALALAVDIEIPKSFVASFTQIVKNNKGKTIKYKGKVYFNAPSETKWNYYSPTKKEVCSSGKQLIVIDHDLEQVSYFSISKGLDLSKVLKSAKLHHGRTYTTEFKGKLYTIILRENGKLEQIAYKDNLDNQVNIIFTTIQYRKNLLPSSYFVCPRPKGYDSVY